MSFSLNLDSTRSLGESEKSFQRRAGLFRGEAIDDEEGESRVPILDRLPQPLQAFRRREPFGRELAPKSVRLVVPLNDVEHIGVVAKPFEESARQSSRDLRSRSRPRRLWPRD